MHSSAKTPPPRPDALRLQGRALHHGGPSALTLRRRRGPASLRVGAHAAAFGALQLARTDRGVCVTLGAGGPAVDLVEHVAAALGGLGCFEGVEVEIEGGEAPLLDGSARPFVEALKALGARPSPPPLRVARRFDFRLGASRYRLAPAPATSVRVFIEFNHPLIGRQSAHWGGDPEGFARYVAPARTFGFADEAVQLWRSGRAQGVDPASVVVFTGDGLAPDCWLASADEPARHKLLDLIGDLALYGGPPVGGVVAERPGHGATHAFVREALARGALVLDRGWAGG
ncbi:MAG TPA: UDP-3-O-acyl-N-acetylglucosamine deacetylase [Polyangiaceae bacterium]|nr:UDP-3-O-acyl-N-acetylglucosamine deacetylase [Polyangiaceae bacterium]